MAIVQNTILSNLFQTVFNQLTPLVLSGPIAYCNCVSYLASHCVQQGKAYTLTPVE